MQVDCSNDKNVQSISSTSSSTSRASIESVVPKIDVQNDLSNKNLDLNSPVSSSVPEEDFYDYGRINDLRTPQPLKISEGSSLKMPRHWIKVIKIKNYKIFDEDEDNNIDVEDIDEDDLFIKQYYLNSRVFMDHFVNNVYPNMLGSSLGFTKDEIIKSTYITGENLS